MAPTRCGEITVKDIINICLSGKYEKKEILELTTRSGVWISHLGTAEAREVKIIIEKAKIVF
jgi:butyrate kinase